MCDEGRKRGGERERMRVFTLTLTSIITLNPTFTFTTPSPPPSPSPSPSPSGNTPLYVAAYEGFSKCVELLVTAKAEVNTRNKDGITPLLATVQNGFVRCTEHLLKAGADPTATAAAAAPKPLSSAIINGSVELVQLLLEHCPISKMYPHLKAGSGVRIAPSLSLTLTHTHTLTLVLILALRSLSPSHLPSFTLIFTLNLTLTLTLALIVRLVRQAISLTPHRTWQRPSSENSEFWGCW